MYQSEELFYIYHVRYDMKLIADKSISCIYSRGRYTTGIGHGHEVPQPMLSHLEALNEGSKLMLKPP